jgi:hypothetical protein
VVRRSVAGVSAGEAFAGQKLRTVLIAAVALAAAAVPAAAQDATWNLGGTANMASAAGHFRTIPDIGDSPGGPPIGPQVSGFANETAVSAGMAFSEQPLPGTEYYLNINAQIWEGA